MENTNNPASRLLVILNDIKSFDVNKTITELWKSLFDLGNKDLHNILLVPIKLIELSTNVEEQISLIPHIKNKNLYTSPVRGLAGIFFNTHHQSQVATLSKSINDTHINTLQICSDMLNSNNLYEKNIPLDDLSSLLEETEQLSKKIMELDIDKDVKTFLMSCIVDLQNAVRYYGINGSNSFEDYIKNNIGSFYLNKNKIQNIDKDEEAKSVFIKIIELMDSTNKLVQFVQNTQLFLPQFTDIIKNIT